GGLTPDAICHRGVARTFQIPRPFRKLSILENVAVGAHFGSATRDTEEESRRRAAEVLTLVGLPTDPEASTALLGAGGLKKLELARALANRPQLPPGAAGLRRRDPPRPAAGRREPGGARPRRDARRGRDAPAHPRRAGRHHRVGGAH